MEVRFGAWSTALAVAIAFAWLVALRLPIAPRNRPANLWLALLLAVAALRIVPYSLGYAGFYDAYPQLTFAPFDLSLALGPLLWLYVTRLTGPALPRWWALHLLPAALQFLYYLACFAQPLATKVAWNGSVHDPYVVPVEQVVAWASQGLYLLASARRIRAYRRWLAMHVSDADEHRLPWLTIATVGLGALLLTQVAFQATDRWIVPLDYFDRFPQYVGYAILVGLLGLEAWRYSSHAFPPMTDAAGTPPVVPVDQTPRRERDWRATAEEWAAQIERGRWWQEPQLTLASAARRLGTNESYLSRALNDGLGQGFNEVVNRMRVRAVEAAIDAGDDRDLLLLALDAGFGSKASFNRAFKAYAGTTPAAYRSTRRAGVAAAPRDAS